MTKYQCRKQRVLAFAVVDSILYVGENFIRIPVLTCPREGMPTGTGYDRCRHICHQPGHAEIDLIRQIPNLKQNPVFITGHDYACKNCLIALIDANSGPVFFVRGAES